MLGAICFVTGADRGNCQTTREINGNHHTFKIEGSQFLMDGQPYQIIAGSMHYPRIPRAAWRERFRLAKAMGLNTITTYVFWNVNEPRPGVYDFSGQNDVAEYIREAQQEGLNVILRPGPYVCAEWELGGYPSWLLKDRSLTLRSEDLKYMTAVRDWFKRLGQEIQPLLLKNGGPIIAVQVENEYGSFGDDHAYLESVKQALIANGMGDTLLYTSNPPTFLANGSLPELLSVINFGTGSAEKGFKMLDYFRPEGPRMGGEYWAGWFDHWGGKHHVTDDKKEAAELTWMLSKGYSVNLYMFDGGTNFGWMNGAHMQADTYEPDTTSYDYDAPVNEAGEPREKYFLFRKAIQQFSAKPLPDVPPVEPRAAYEISAQQETASLWKSLPEPVPVSQLPLPTMEDLNQSYGYILYRTRLRKDDGGELTISGLHDYAQIYINQTLIGTLDRRLHQDHLILPKTGKDRTLDILVENSGRVNFTQVIRTERKGITGSVMIGERTPDHWQVYSLPLLQPDKLHFSAAPCSGPCFVRMKMNVTTPRDTYLETPGVKKGDLWINGTMLGRIWSIGPQYTLYTPGSWLKEGSNELVLFDLQHDSTGTIRCVMDPIFIGTQSGRN